MQRRTMLKSKIHRATVTESHSHGEDAVTIDPELLKAADILEYELVTVLDADNGVRFETHAIAGRSGSGDIQVNGSAGRLVHPGDHVSIVSYAVYMAVELGVIAPRVIHVDGENHIVPAGNPIAHLATR